MFMSTIPTYCVNKTISRKIIFLIIILCLAAFTQLPTKLYAEKKTSSPTKHISTEDTYVKPEIYDVKPSISKGISTYNTLLLDIFIPGGGHFYRDDYALGTAFLLIKTSAIGLTYYFYKDMDNKRSHYQNTSSRSAQMNYERASRNYTFALVFDVVLYMTSAYINLYNTQKINTRLIPAFEVSFYNAISKNEEKQISLFYTYRL